MEYLDIYDENGNYLGKEDRKVVHRDALWHNTVHCWLYDKDGNIYFQIRADLGKLYTTASGHIKSGETIKEGFGREINEEIGINVDYEQAILVNVCKFIMDRENNDGSVFRDRAFANVYTCLFDDKEAEFNFDEDEVLGLVKINAEKALDLLEEKIDFVDAFIIKNENGKNTISEKKIVFEDFLVNKGETATGKYGDILKKVIDLTK